MLLVLNSFRLWRSARGVNTPSGLEESSITVKPKMSIKKELPRTVKGEAAWQGQTMKMAEEMVGRMLGLLYLILLIQLHSVLKKSLGL